MDYLNVIETHSRTGVRREYQIMKEQLIQLAIEEAPAIIAYLKLQFGKKNPDAPQPGDAEVIEAYESAFRSSVARDERWLATHPQS